MGTAFGFDRYTTEPNTPAEAFARWIAERAGGLAGAGAELTFRAGRIISSIGSGSVPPARR